MICTIPNKEERSKQQSILKAKPLSWKYLKRGRVYSIWRNSKERMWTLSWKLNKTSVIAQVKNYKITNSKSFKKHIMPKN